MPKNDSTSTKVVTLVALAGVAVVVFFWPQKSKSDSAFFYPNDLHTYPGGPTAHDQKVLRDLGHAGTRTRQYFVCLD